MPEQTCHWHRAPAHKLSERGTYMVTAGTYQKRLLFDSVDKKELITNTFFRLADEFQWQPQAWAFMNNHYHVIMISPEHPETLPDFIKGLHRITASELNKIDNTKGRQVWFNYWDKQLTFPNAYYARLNYVHHNPVHHKIISVAENYRWCSAWWFNQHAPPGFRQMVESFGTERLHEPDDF